MQARDEIEKIAKRADFLTAPKLIWWKQSFIVVPFISMLVNAALAVGLSQTTLVESALIADRGLRMIGLLSTASISIVTLTFSLTVLSVQIASQSYTPRLLDEFIKDPVPKAVISVNLGAFVYCFTLSYLIDGADGFNPKVSRLAINLLTLHCALVMVTFVTFIHLFIDGFRVEKILGRAASSSLSAADNLSSKHDNIAVTSHDEQPEVPTFAYKVLANRSGYVTGYHLQSIVNGTEHLDICIRYHRQIGEFVNEGTLICYLWDAKTRVEKSSSAQSGVRKDDCSERTEKGDGSERARLEKRLLNGIVYETDVEHRPMEEHIHKKLSYFCSKGISISSKRTGDMDMTLGIQQLSDIAVRALSPGVNDPHTAIQCMDVLSSLFATLSVMDLSIPSARDRDGNLRLYAPRRSFSYLLSLLDGIRRYGRDDVAVCRRGLRLFGDLGVILTRAERLDRVPAVLAQLEQWMLVSKNNFAKCSPELTSLEHFYDYLLKSIRESEHMLLQSNESIAKGQQDVDVVYHDKATSSADDLDMASDKHIVMDFINSMTTASESPERS